MLQQLARPTRHRRPDLRWPGEHFPSSCSPFSHHSPSSGSSRLKRLPPPKPTWSWRKSDLAVAFENASKRKSIFTKDDYEILEALRPQVESLMPRRQTIGREQNRVGTRIKELMEEARNKEREGKSRRESEEELTTLQSKAKRLKEEAKEITTQTDKINEESLRLRLKLPNTTHSDVPVGSEEKAKIIGIGGNLKLLKQEVREKAQSTTFPIPLLESRWEKSQPEASRDHLEILSGIGLVDTHGSQLTTGPNWPFLLGSLAKLEHALVRHALEMADEVGFESVVVPDVIKRDILSRTGFSPREGSGGQVYWVQADGAQSGAQNAATRGESDDDLSLAATAEISLAGLCAGQLYDTLDRPKLLVAASHSFRAEAGARGADSRGLYRVHQFTKVEMFVICKASESESWLEKLRETQEKVVQKLEIPYRVLDMPTEELGASAHRKYDIEAWMPGRGSWGEISSASNCTEYQSRRLYIRYRSTDAISDASKSGPSPNASEGHAWAHTLNGTAAAIPRLIVALVENHGISSDGKLRLPESLRPHWIGKREEVEWLSSQHSSSSDARNFTRKKSMMGSAIEKVRVLAKRQGTDPASMVFSFFILHEITAIVPLIFFFYLLGLLGAGQAVLQWFIDAAELSKDQEDRGEYWNVRRWSGRWVQEGTQRAERYGRRKGLFGFGKDDDDNAATVMDSSNSMTSGSTSTALAGSFANAVAAYALVKALVPLRIAASIGLAGPFARVCIEPFKRLARRTRT